MTYEETEAYLEAKSQEIEKAQDWENDEGAGDKELREWFAWLEANEIRVIEYDDLAYVVNSSPGAVWAIESPKQVGCEIDLLIIPRTWQPKD